MDQLLVALDVDTADEARALAARLRGVVGGFKVGSRLFTSHGPSIVEELVSHGDRVFLDLKFHDIPNTVAGAVRSAAALGVHMITIHAGGGPAMLSAARAALAGVASPPELLAVTVLTSMDAEQLAAVGVESAPMEQAQTLALAGRAAGLRGFVCSPREVAMLRALTGPEGVLVIPGIRPAGAETGDQRRIATPADALRLGASYLVVGRPITQAPNPAAAAEAILQEMATAL